MGLLRYAILAVLVAATPRIGAEPPVVLTEQPLRVRFRLADGVEITGHLSAWDSAGIDGSFGRREWIELNLDDVWRLYRRLMDPESADHWVALGAVLLQIPDGQKRAERSFGRARQIDPEVSQAIDEARRQAAEVERRKQEAMRKAEAVQLRTRSPEAGPWPAARWPSMTPEQQETARFAMKAAAAEVLSGLGLEASPIESDYFLVYSNLPRRDAAEWALLLDDTHDRLDEYFHRTSGDNIFWGKAVAFIFDDADRFRLIEATAFNQLVPRDVSGMCHFRGPQVFINLHVGDDPDQVAADVVRQAVLGYMHRYISPRRLPAWANEGFTTHVLSIVSPGSSVAETQRESGREFIRAGGDVSALLALDYSDDKWLPNAAIGTSVGSLVVDLMIDQKPVGFVSWVNATKDGVPWPEALTTAYGASPCLLVERSIAFYRVND